jgi:hypothetical protein
MAFMKLKASILLILAVLIGSSQLSSLNQAVQPHWHSILHETPETHAIVALLKVYKTDDANGPIQLRRIGKAHDGGYVIPELAMQEADVVIGYGIANDISFEDLAAAIYGKPSYGFDCTCPSIQPMQKECHFISSCIVNEKSIKPPSYGSFDQHVNLVGATGKNVFLKMDIEGNEYDTMPDILQRASNITGIVLEIHFMEPQQIAQALHLLEMLDKDFLLVHVHGNNHCRDGFVTTNSRGYIPRVLELSYINKLLVQSYEISSDQTHPTHLDMSNAPNLPDVAFTILD